MPALAADRPILQVTLRAGRPADVDALFDLENRVFDYDRMSRRGFRRVLASESAALIVAEQDGGCAGYALVFFRRSSRIARLYSLAVAPASAGRGLGTLLLAAAEDAARRRGATAMRLEVHERNLAAIARYRKSGYLLFGRYIGYYDDRADALRFQKPLPPLSGAADDAVPPVDSAA